MCHRIPTWPSGPNAIVEVVNVQLAVYGKSGALVAGPTNIQSLFSSLKGDCSANTYGDPIVLYDRLADRWVVTMLGAGSTYSECVPFPRPTIRPVPIIYTGIRLARI